MTESTNKRLLFFAPGVQKGKEKEPRCEDFICFDSRALGQGAFGEVFKVKHKISGKDFAIKVIPKRKIIERRMLSQLRREIRIMYSLNHPNIISLYSHFEDASNFYLILELAPGGQLFNKLQKFKNFTEPVAAQYMREVCLAVQYLHSRLPPIIHRDIKPENILLDAGDEAKLGDFGWSNFFDEERETYCGTLEYLAPEMIERKGHGVSLDIWALGVLLYEMLVGVSPFKSRTQEDLFNKIKHAKVIFPKAFPLLAKDLIKRMLQVDPEKRPTAEMVLEHSWILSHAPLRPTAELVKVRVELPTVPEEGDVEFTDSECFIVSATKHVLTPSSQKNSKINLEIALKQEEIKRLTARIEKTKTNSRELSERIEKLCEENKVITVLNVKIEAITKKNNEITHKNNLVYKRYISKIAELKLIKKRRSITSKKIMRLQSDFEMKKMKLQIFQKTAESYLKINCFVQLKAQIEELHYAVFLLSKACKMPEYIRLAEKQLREIHSSANSATELENYIPEFKRMFSQKSKSVKSLSTRLKDLKTASILQSQIIKAIKPK